MKKTTFLGPVGATFSHDAYTILANIYGVPETEIEAATKNGDILAMVAQHEGYGAIAMETLAEARIGENVESFILLLRKYASIEACPFRIIGSIRMKLHFCLMGRKGMAIESAERIVAHQKAIGACKGNIEARGVATEVVDSNGKAAELVAQNEQYAQCLALGPKSAAEKYGLEILDPAFEDQEAITTFFLLGPKDQPVRTGKENRVLIVYKVPHTPGSLVRSLLPFDEEGINLIQIHSIHAGSGVYHFAIEVVVKEDQLDAFVRAKEKFEQHVDIHLCFGPFEVLST